jgi:outer membrane lipoprotein-sorting protein
MRPAAVATLVLPLMAAATCAADGAAPATLAARLCARYARVRTVTCRVEKLTSSGDATVRMLSRVVYVNPQRVNIEISSPSKRRIVCDGRQLYYYEEGAPRGFSQPVGELNDTWAAALHNIPGTPMEHLLRLQGIPESSLAPLPDFPLRRGYEAGKVFAVLSCDRGERLARIEFFSSSAMTNEVARYEYSEFVEAGEDCWFARLHKAVLRLPEGEQVTEVRRVSGLKLDEPADDSLFDPAPYFAGVTFTNDFRMTYESPAGKP